MQDLTAAFRYTGIDTRLVGPDNQKALTLWNTQTASATVRFKQTSCSENQEMTALISSWGLFLVTSPIRGFCFWSLVVIECSGLAEPCWQVHLKCCCSCQKQSGRMCRVLALTEFRRIVPERSSLTTWNTQSQLCQQTSHHTQQKRSCKQVIRDLLTRALCCFALFLQLSGQTSFLF